MPVRAVVALSTWLVGAWASPQDASRPSSRPRRPNLVLILADDLGYGEIGCYGQRRIATPRLDAMASEGTRFVSWYAPAPVCAPTRCQLITGRHAGHAFVRDNRELPVEGQLPLPADTVTLPRLLRQQGYATGMVGKWGLGGPGCSGEPGQQGFGEWFGFLCQRHAHDHFPAYLWHDGRRVTLDGKQYAQTLFMDRALAFVRAHRERPFFLYLPVTIPHVAIQNEPADLVRYQGKLDDAPYEGQHGYRPHPAPHAGYAAMVTRLDQDVGRVLDLLRELGLERDTLVVVTSDNGPTHGRVGGADSAFFDSTAGLRGLKGSLFEGGIRVPLLARWPGRVPAGRVSGHVGAHQDLMPTFLEIAGAAVPGDLDGLSCLRALCGEAGQRAHEFLYWEFPGYGGQVAVRLGRWKALRVGLVRQPDAPWQLFDLAADPAEERDVAAAHPDVVARVQALARAAHVPSPEFPFPALDH